jgi:hypothetical protein
MIRAGSALARCRVGCLLNLYNRDYSLCPSTPFAKAVLCLRCPAFLAVAHVRSGFRGGTASATAHGNPDQYRQGVPTLPAPHRLQRPSRKAGTASCAGEPNGGSVVSSPANRSSSPTFARAAQSRPHLALTCTWRMASSKPGLFTGTPTVWRRIPQLLGPKSPFPWQPGFIALRRTLTDPVTAYELNVQLATSWFDAAGVQLREVFRTRLPVAQPQPLVPLLRPNVNLSHEPDPRGASHAPWRTMHETANLRARRPLPPRRTNPPRRRPASACSPGGSSQHACPSDNVELSTPVTAGRARTVKNRRGSASHHASTLTFEPYRAACAAPDPRWLSRRHEGTTVMQIGVLRTMST